MEAKVWDVLVIGAGISGLEVANRLGNLGYDILLVEKDPTLGGRAKLYNCKAIGDACTKCNACLVNDKIREVLSNQKVVPLVSSFIQDAQKEGGLFQTTLQKDGEESYATSKSFILCGGFPNPDSLS
ncbi:MAG: FAD-dependent oxidoreductase, partial [Desulfatiglandales bacterium]